MLRIATTLSTETTEEPIHTSLSLEELTHTGLGLGIPPRLMNPTTEASLPDDSDQVFKIRVDKTASTELQKKRKDLGSLQIDLILPKPADFCVKVEFNMPRGNLGTPLNEC